MSHLCTDKNNPSMPQPINAKNFDAVVLNSSLPVVVDVWADWCGPCKMIAPHFAAAEEELKGKARFVKLDADKNQKLVRKYKVMGIPTLLFFKDGQLVDRSTGVTTKAAIVRRVKPLLANEDQEGMKTGFNWKFWEYFGK
jgi:thioredoxin